MMPSNKLWFSTSNFNRVLCYHQFKDIVNFEKHLVHLRGGKSLITIDDGDPSVYENAFPLFKRQKVCFVLFIITELIGTDKPFWWDEVRHYLGNEEGDKKVRALKNVPNRERIAFLEELRIKSDKPPLRYPQLTVEQLKEMQAAGMVIANHSHTHPMFDQCTEEEIRTELRSSKAFFDRHGLSGYSVFAYPNGNFNETAERILKEEGIEMAFLFDHKLNKGKINPMRISRLSVNDNTPIWKLRFILSGWHSKLLPVRKFVSTVLR